MITRSQKTLASIDALECFGDDPQNYIKDFDDAEIEFVIINFEIKTIDDLRKKLLKSSKAKDPDVNAHLYGFASAETRKKEISECEELMRELREKVF